MNSQPSEEQVIQSIYNIVANLMKEGKSREEIIASLKSCGLDEEAACVAIDNVLLLRKEGIENTVKHAGKSNMLIGALTCIVGIVVTALTYLIAANRSHGGVYIVAWGAIVFGAIQFFRGLSKVIDND